MLRLTTGTVTRVVKREFSWRTLHVLVRIFANLCIFVLNGLVYGCGAWWGDRQFAIVTVFLGSGLNPCRQHLTTVNVLLSYKLDLQR